MSDSLMVSLQVKNEGAVTADEVVFFFVRDMVGSYTRPVKELKGFKKVTLRSGESTTAIFLLPASDLSFWTAKQQYGA